MSSVILRIEHTTATDLHGLPLGPYARDYAHTDDLSAVGALLHEQHPVDDPDRPAWHDERWVTADGKMKAIWGIDNWMSLRSGFASGRDLTSWFTAEQRELLEDCGFVVQQYLVDPAAIVTGRRQIAFDPDAAFAAGSTAPTAL